jgi:phosphate starvation-inducible PhoH-like protein
MSESVNFDLIPADNSRLANLCGQFNEHLHQMENYFDVGIDCRSNHFQIRGRNDNAQAAMNTIKTLYEVAEKEALIPRTIQLYMSEAMGDIRSGAQKDSRGDNVTEKKSGELPEWGIKTRKGKVKGRGHNQKQYLSQIKSNDLTLGIGPAGTGKTYLAVACAVDALENDKVDRLILVRPAVEAGERLGFLPGDLSQKVDPYLRPMYDALYEMMGIDKVAKLIDHGVIEIAPLAYMRGRTLNDAFIILDEAQNTTTEQMKMFLTRIGFGSKAVVTGDITQVDLPREKKSGLRHAMTLLNEIEGIGVTLFNAQDVVRHPLVKEIVHAYEKDEES